MRFFLPTLYVLLLCSPTLMWYTEVVVVPGYTIVLSTITVLAILTMLTINISADVIGGSFPNKLTNMVKQLPCVQRGYRPPWFLKNEHLQTIYSVLGRKQPKDVKYQRKIIKHFFPDGEKVVLDILHHNTVTGEQHIPSAVVMILHGLSGGSHDLFVQHLARTFALRGWDSVVCLRRGCGIGQGVELTHDRHYEYGNHHDMHHVFEYVSNTLYNRATTKFFAVGISAGANSLANVLGRFPQNPVVDGAVCIANGFCWEKGTQTIRDEHPWWNAVLTTFAFRTFYYRHASMRQSEKVDKTKAHKAWCIRDFDEAVSRRVHGYESLKEFYYNQSSCHVIRNITVPTLFLNARDDPIASIKNVPIEDIQNNPNTVLVVTPHGGHLGWAQGWNAQGRSYMDDISSEFLDLMLQQSKV
eukprot:PhF_6_TR9767/c0_g1_i1/m.15052